MYPKIVLNYDKLVHNTKKLVNICHQRDFTVMGVIKSLNGWQEAIAAIAEGGVDYIADSRLDNLKYINSNHERVLLRIPMLSEVKDVITYTDISLNSTFKTINQLNSECITQNKRHKIIFMFDLGDLREGLFYKDNFIEIISRIIELDHIDLIGIGTNLTCYGGIISTEKTLEKLHIINRILKKSLNLDLPIISAGNSSMLHLIANKEIDLSKYNNIRLGESLILGRETAFGKSIKEMYSDTVQLFAEVIEVYNKPSLPEGKVGMDAFGNKPTFEDKGIMKRAIVALGKQDVDMDSLIPRDENIQLVGMSSDHLIIDITDSSYKVGDIIEFNLTYSGVFRLTSSPYVKKEVLYGTEN